MSRTREGFFDALDGGVASHEQRDDHVGENNDVANGQHGKGFWNLNLLAVVVSNHSDVSWVVFKPSL
jgi:hypothetical protein